MICAVQNKIMGLLQHTEMNSNEFIEAVETSPVLIDDFMLDPELLKLVVGPVMSCSTSENPIGALVSLFSNTGMDKMFQLNTDNEESVRHLAAIVNSCTKLSVKKFEKAIGSYINFLCEEAVPREPSIDVREIIAKTYDVCPTNAATVCEAEEVNTVKSLSTARGRGTRQAMRRDTPPPPPPVVEEKAASPPLLLPDVEEKPTTAQTQLKRRRPGIPVFVDEPQKNNQAYLVGVAGKIAAVRSIDINNPVGRFRSPAVLDKSELVANIRSARGRAGCIDYIRSVFPRLDGMDSTIYELMTEDMMDSAKRPTLRGLSNLILNYETQLRDLMISCGVGNVARILAIGQMTSSVLDGRQSQDRQSNNIKHKRLAILHEDVDISSHEEMLNTIKTCGGTARVVRDLLQNRVSHILKHIQNKKVQDSVDRHNRGIVSTRVSINRSKYDKHVFAIELSQIAHSYCLENYNIAASVFQRPLARENMTVDLEDIHARRKQADIWATGTVGKLLYHREYMSTYEQYYKELSQIRESLSKESSRLCCATNDIIKEMGCPPIHPIVRTVVRCRERHNRINFDSIPVRNTGEGRRYITLLDDKVPDFSSTVARSNELVKYETNGKTTTEVIETMSHLLSKMSTASNIEGSDLRRMSQILLSVATGSTA